MTKIEKAVERAFKACGLKSKVHILGRDPDGHRWPLTEGWRCLYCGVRDPRMVLHRRGDEPEVLLASIPPCEASEADKTEVDRFFPMPIEVEEMAVQDQRRWHLNGGRLLRGIPQPVCGARHFRNLSPRLDMVNCRRCLLYKGGNKP